MGATTRGPWVLTLAVSILVLVFWRPSVARGEDCPRAPLLADIDEAMALVQKGAAGDAREVLAALDSCYRRYSEYWFYRGLLEYSDARANERDDHALTRRIDAAARDMRYAMDIDPGRISYWRGYALVMFELRRDRQAVAYFEKYFAAPEDALGPQPLRMLAPYLTSLVRLEAFDRAMRTVRMQRARLGGAVTSCGANLTYVWNVYDKLLRRGQIQETEAASEFFDNACGED